MKTILYLVGFLLMAPQVSAGDIVTKVNRIEITVLHTAVKIKHDSGEDCITIPYITSVRYHKKLGRVSITVHRGNSFHYDFGKGRTVQAKATFRKLRMSIFKGKFIKWYKWTDSRYREERE